MTTKIALEIINKAMPKARVIERKVFDVRTDLKVDAVTPDTDSLIRKYAKVGLDKAAKTRRVGKSLDKKPESTARDNDDVEAAEVSLESTSVDTPPRLMRRTILVDKRKKRIIGITG